jgi:hypothetical protein
MARPRTIKKLTLPVADLRSMSDDHRYAVLLLGLFLNEVNWLRKLLVKAVFGITEGPEPDGQANFGLTALLARPPAFRRLRNCPYYRRGLTRSRPGSGSFESAFLQRRV